MAIPVPIKKDMFDVREQTQGIREELPQTRLGVTTGRLLMAGSLGFLVVCGALYQTALKEGEKTGVENKKERREQTSKRLQPGFHPKECKEHPSLKEEIAFNVALELVQRQMN